MNQKKLLLLFLSSVLISTANPVSVYADKTENKTNITIKNNKNSQNNQNEILFNTKQTYSIGDKVEGDWNGLIWEIAINEDSDMEKEKYKLTLTLKPDKDNPDRKYEDCIWRDNTPWTDRHNLINESQIREITNKIIVEDGITTIGDYAFDCFNATEIEMGKDVTDIKTCGLFGCKMKTVKLPDKLKYMGKYAFACCTSLERIELPKSLETLDDSAFECCQALESVSVPEGTYVGEYVFNQCGAMENAYIYNDALSKGEFANCRNLKALYISDNLSYFNIKAFENNNSLETIKIENKSLWDYIDVNEIPMLNNTKVVLLYTPETITVKNNKNAVYIKWSRSKQNSNVNISNKDIQYYIYRSDGNTTELLDKVNGKRLSYSDKSAEANTAYTYYVTASYKNLNESPKTTSASIVYLRTTNIEKAKNKGNSITLNWKKQYGVRGYKILYSTDRNFKNDVNKCVIANNSKTGTTIKNLKKGETYYIKFMTYQKRNEKYYYSSSSNVKVVTIK